MKKRIQWIAMAICIICCCTSCFDLQENLFLKNDGTGSFSFIVNIEQMKSFMGMFENTQQYEPDTNRNAKNNTILKNEFITNIENVKLQLNKIPGIHHAIAINDTAKYNFGISFDFNDISALNLALNKLFNGDDTSKQTTTFFEYKDHQLTRLEALDTKSILGKTSSLNTDNNSQNAHTIFDPKLLFNTATYTATYEFENKIIHTQNTLSKVSNDNKKIFLQIHPFAAIKDSTQPKQTIANTITLKQ